MTKNSLFFEAEKMKEFRETGADQSEVVRKFAYQKGKSNVRVDRRRAALPPGKRISKTGKVYWESRKNRSDLAKNV